jgi:hypothetical protein
MPTMTARAYAGGIVQLMSKTQNWTSDTLKVALCSSSYAPNWDSDTFQSAFTGYELSSGNGYVNGGQAVSGASVSKVAANSWSSQWTATTTYTTGQFVRPTSGNGYIYYCQVGGTTGGSQPSWPTTIGASVTDSGATWTCIGHGAAILTMSNVVWSSFAAGPFLTAVLFDSAPGTAGTNPLILSWQFGSSQTGGGGNFTIAIDPSGAMTLPY